MSLNQTKFQTFMDTYAKHLATVVVEKSDMYAWAKTTPVNVVVQCMAQAVLKNSFDKDGEAFKRTCKELGIKHTYKAIDVYLERT